jgi:hypothetical protein
MKSKTNSISGRTTDHWSVRDLRNPRGKRTFSKQRRAAQGAAVERENAPIDPDLEAIVVRWSGLPEAIKSEILRMVNAQSAS